MPTNYSIVPSYGHFGSSSRVVAVESHDSYGKAARRLAALRLRGSKVRLVEGDGPWLGHELDRLPDAVDPQPVPIWGSAPFRLAYPSTPGGLTVVQRAGYHDLEAARQAAHSVVSRRGDLRDVAIVRVAGDEDRQGTLVERVLGC